MPRLLTTVEVAFEVTGRGLIVVPGPLAEDFHGAAEVVAELHRPDGSVLWAPLKIQHYCQTPPPREYRWGCMFPTLSKQDVPPGTEVWVDEP